MVWPVDTVVPLAGFEVLATEITGGGRLCVTLQGSQVGGLVPPPPLGTTLLATLPAAELFTVTV